MTTINRLLLAAIVGSTLTLSSCGDTAEQPNASTEAGTPAPPEPAPTAPPAREGARTLPIPVDGSTGLPAGHPPVGTPAGGIPPPPPGAGEGAQGLRWKIPASWVNEPPSSTMRRAQYRVPGPAGDGECVVYYFGPGQGGDPMSNATRWAGQFTQPDGRPPEQAMKTSAIDVPGIEVMEVEVTGTYSGGMTMSAAPAEDKPGYMLLGAIAAGPDANWFFKLTGPEATIRSQRAAFEDMLRSLEVGK